MDNRVYNQEQEFLEKQKSICAKYGAQFLASPFDKLIGVTLETFEKFQMPVNGLRHPIKSEQSANWFIWAGEYSEANDFFKPGHIIICLRYAQKP